MNQTKIKEAESEQVEYLGKWVSKKYFRVYVYNAGSKKLADSWNKYNELIKTGLWFSTQEEAQPKQLVPIRSGRKPKNGADS
jgi:hypothetical protein